MPKNISNQIRQLSFDVTVMTDFMGCKMKERYAKMAEIQNAINSVLQDHAAYTGSAQIYNSRCPRVEVREG